MKKWTIGLGSLLAAGALTAGMALNVGAAQISEARAKEIALKNAGVKEGDVSYINVKTDWEDGRQVYDVEFYTKDYREYDYEISAWTGEIISRDYDAESRGERWAKAGAERREAAAGTAVLTAEEAKAAALKDAGLKESQVEGLRVHQDWDDGRVVYEGKFYYHELEYEFEVDGNTGRLIDWDVESIYD